MTLSPEELNHMIDAAHDGWMGRKKPWVAVVWEILYERYLDNNLCDYLYELPVRDEETATENMSPSSHVPASSSSQMQEEPNTSSAIENEKRCTDFPKNDPVEEAPVVHDEDDTAMDLEDDEAAMQRWVEMVECVDMLEKIEWLPDLPDTPENAAALKTIFKLGMKYCTTFLHGCLQPWKMDDWPLNPRVWLAEMERVLKAMARRNRLPYWLLRPHDRNIRDDAQDSATGSVDPGNYVLDMVVHALRLWQYAEAGRTMLVLKQSIKEYGERGNKSSKGPVNLRGNIVEAMQKNLQQTGTKLVWDQVDYDAVEYWWNWEESQRTTPWWGQSGRGRGAASSSSWRQWTP